MAGVKWLATTGFTAFRLTLGYGDADLTQSAGDLPDTTEPFNGVEKVLPDNQSEPIIDN